MEPGSPAGSMYSMMRWMQRSPTAYGVPSSSIGIGGSAAVLSYSSASSERSAATSASSRSAQVLIALPVLRQAATCSSVEENAARASTSGGPETLLPSTSNHAVSGGGL